MSNMHEISAIPNLESLGLNVGVNGDLNSSNLQTSDDSVTAAAAALNVDASTKNPASTNNKDVKNKIYQGQHDAIDETIMNLPESSSIDNDDDNSSSNNEKKYPCPQCEHTFTRKHNLKSHLLTHTNQRPFSCAHCPSQFRRQYDLKRHEKIHTREKSHICKACGKGFARADALLRHMNSNSGCQLPTTISESMELLDHSRKIKRRKISTPNTNVLKLIPSTKPENNNNNNTININTDDSNFFAQEAIANSVTQSGKNKEIDLQSKEIEAHGELTNNEASIMPITTNATNSLSNYLSMSQAESASDNLIMNVPTLNLSLISGLLSDILSNNSTNSQGISSIQLSENQFSVLTSLLETLQNLDLRVTRLENKLNNALNDKN